MQMHYLLDGTKANPSTINVDNVVAKADARLKKAARLLAKANKLGKKHSTGGHVHGLGSRRLPGSSRKSGELIDLDNALSVAGSRSPRSNATGS